MPAHRNPLRRDRRTSIRSTVLLWGALLAAFAVSSPIANGHPIGAPGAPAGPRATVNPAPPMPGPTGALFVAPYGNDHNPCSYAAPCRQVGEALARAGPGGTIVLANGSYDGFAIEREVARPSAPLTIVAPGRDAVLRPSTDPADPLDTIDVVASAYVVLNGLRAGNAPGADVRIAGSDHVTVENGTFGNATVAGIQILRSDATYLFNDRVYRTARGPGISVVGGTTGTDLIGNMLGWNQGPGVLFQAAPTAGTIGVSVGATIDGNIFHQNGGNGGVPALRLLGTSNSTVANDLFYANFGGGISVETGASALLIAFNTIVQSQSAKWALSIGNSSGPIRVADNILDRSNAGQTGIAYAAPADVNWTESDHNVLGAVSPAEGTGRVPLATWQGDGYEMGSFTAAPQFLFQDPGAGNYQLLPGAPTIGAGVGVAGISFDLLGIPRPTNGPVDLGCFEFVPQVATGLGLSIAATPVEGVAPLTVELAVTPLGGVGPYSFAWNLGDGSSAVGRSLSHLYAGPGVYTVELLGTDGQHRVGSAYVNVTVESPAGTGFPVTFRPLDLPTGLVWSLDAGGVTLAGTGPLTLQNVPAGGFAVALSPVVAAAPFLRWTPAEALWVNVSGPMSVPVPFVPYAWVEVGATAGGTAAPGPDWQAIGSVIQLTATAQPGFLFEGWAGTGTGAYTGGIVAVRMVVEASITESARFAPGTPAVTLGPSPPGLGALPSSLLPSDWTFAILSVVVLAVAGAAASRFGRHRRLWRGTHRAGAMGAPAPWSESLSPLPPSAPAIPPWLES